MHTQWCVITCHIYHREAEIIGPMTSIDIIRMTAREKLRCGPLQISNF